MTATTYRPLDVDAASIRRLIRSYQARLNSQAPGTTASAYSEGAIRALEQVLEMDDE